MELLEMCQSVIEDILNELINRYYQLSSKRFSTYTQQIFGFSNPDVNHLKEKDINDHLLADFREIKIESISLTQYFNNVEALLRGIQSKIIEFYTTETMKLQGLSKELMDRQINQDKENKADNENDKKNTEDKPTPLWALTLESIKKNYTEAFSGSNLENLTNETLKILGLLKTQIDQISLQASIKKTKSKIFDENSKKIIIKSDLPKRLLSYFFKFLVENPSVMSRHSEDFKKITEVFFVNPHKIGKDSFLPRLTYLSQLEEENDINDFMQDLNNNLASTLKEIKESDHGVKKGAKAFFTRIRHTHSEGLDKIGSGKREALCSGVFSEKCFGKIELYPRSVHLKTA